MLVSRVQNDVLVIQILCADRSREWMDKGLSYMERMIGAES